VNGKLGNLGVVVGIKLSQIIAVDHVHGSLFADHDHLVLVRARLVRQQQDAPGTEIKVGIVKMTLIVRGKVVQQHKIRIELQYRISVMSPPTVGVKRAVSRG